MSRLRLFLLLCVVLVAVGCAQEKVAQAAAAGSVDELIAAYEKDMDAIRAALKKARDEQRSSELMERFKRTPLEYLPRIGKAAEAAKGTPAEPRGLAWMYLKTRDRAAKEKLLERLLKDFKRSAAMDQVCLALARSGRKDAVLILEDQLAQNPHRQVQGQACYALTQRMKGNQGSWDDLPPDKRKRTERLLERVLKEYADLPHFLRGTLGANAKADLFELRRLMVGSIAPEIEGKDLDGVPFKLSDYRGKVVLLDFWGHW